MFSLSPSPVAMLLAQSLPPQSEADALSNLQVIFDWIPPIAAVIVAIAAIYCTWMWRQRFSRPQQIGNIPDYVRDVYLAKYFDDSGGTRTSFRDERPKARQAVEGCSSIDGGASGTPPCCGFHEESLKDGENGRPGPTDQNRFCYELSLSLENVGLMVFVRALPLDVVLALVAPLIVDDWGYCRHLVQQIRKGKEWHRRHGEWLACVAGMWLAADKESPNDFAHLIKRAGGLRTLSKREESIRKGEKHRLMKPPRDVQKFVKKLRKALGKRAEE